MRNNPCKNCVSPKRHVGCHATCKEYADARQEHDSEKSMIREAKRVRDDVVEVNLTSIRRNRQKLYTRKW